MKVLLDENIPPKLKFDFVPDHEVFTVREMGWSGKKNGNNSHPILQPLGNKNSPLLQNDCIGKRVKID